MSRRIYFWISSTSDPSGERRLQSDLIAVPLSLDLVNDCSTTKELVDELVRRADCAVLGVPLAQRKQSFLFRGKVQRWVRPAQRAVSVVLG